MNRTQLIKLAKENPKLRAKLVPLIRSAKSPSFNQPTNTSNQTAKQLYDIRKKLVLKKLKMLEQYIQGHASRAAKDPLNWGYAGDLGHILEQLNEALPGQG